MVAVEERVVLLVLLQVGGRAQVSRAAPTVVREGVPLRTVADLKDEGRGGPGTVEAGVGEAGWRACARLDASRSSSWRRPSCARGERATTSETGRRAPAGTGTRAGAGRDRDEVGAEPPHHSSALPPSCAHSKLLRRPSDPPQVQRASAPPVAVHRRRPPTSSSSRPRVRARQLPAPHALLERRLRFGGERRAEQAGEQWARAPSTAAGRATERVSRAVAGVQRREGRVEGGTLVERGCSCVESSVGGQGSESGRARAVGNERDDAEQAIRDAASLSSCCARVALAMGRWRRRRARS